MIGFEHRHAIGNVGHVPASAVIGLAGHALEDKTTDHGLGVAQTFNRHHDERIGIVFPEGILGLKLDEEAFAGEAALKRSLELREDVAVPVQIGEPLGARFLKNLSGHVRHANGQGYEHVFLDGKRHVFTPSRTRQPPLPDVSNPLAVRRRGAAAGTASEKYLRPDTSRTVPRPPNDRHRAACAPRTRS